MTCVEPLGWTLIRFLWQGTLIAAVYALVRALAPRSNVNARYAAACVALAAMLAAPVVTLTSWNAAGERQVTGSSAAPAPHVAHAAARSPLPFGGAASRRLADDAMDWVVAIWAAGAATLGIRLLGGCMAAGRMRSRQIRPAPEEWQKSIERLRLRLGGIAPVRLLLSPLVDTPMVVGWWRPVVLAPVGVLTGMPPDYLRALLAHELAHIRRHDYLVNLMQRFVEALLFYHPAVWWVSGHIRAERELCCDDVAASVCGDRVLYARALAELELLRPRPLAEAMAASGGALPMRIARLLGRSRPEPQSLPVNGALFAALLVAGAAVFGQPTDAPQFEVASIKPARVPVGHPIFFGMRSDPGRFTGSYVSLLDLVSKAYGVDVTRISGAGDWAAADRFEVIATLPPGTKETQIPQRLQALLAERFGLVVRRESRVTRVYALVPAKGGPRMKRAEIASDPTLMGIPKMSGSTPLRITPNGKVGLCCGRAMLQTSMSRFADLLSAVTDRPVVDATGLEGIYDVSLEWSPDASPVPVDNPLSTNGGPSIYTAVQEQLGLKLEGRMAPLDYVVIEHAEKPAGN